MEEEDETRAAVYHGGSEINSSCRVRNRLDPDGGAANLPSDKPLKYTANEVLDFFFSATEEGHCSWQDLDWESLQSSTGSPGIRKTLAPCQILELTCHNCLNSSSCKVA